MSVLPTAASRAGLCAGLLAIVLAIPAAAQDDWETEEIPDRLDETLRGLLDRMKPTIEDMFEMWGTLEQIDSPTNYDKPVILPNGDILIPRRPDAPAWQPDNDDDPVPEPKQRPNRKPDPDESTRI